MTDEEVTIWRPRIIEVLREELVKYGVDVSRYSDVEVGKEDDVDTVGAIFRGPDGHNIRVEGIDLAFGGLEWHAPVLD